MKLAIVGYGKMGKNIEQLAPDFGFMVSDIFDSQRDFLVLSEETLAASQADVFVEFTGPQSAANNLFLLAQKGCRVVCGSTGWQAEEDKIHQAFRENQGSFLHGNNFSSGMQVFFEVGRILAKKMSSLRDYDPFLQEEHHRNKKDAPSGTACQIQTQVADYFPHIDTVATRAGYIVGRHTLGFDGRFDQLRLEHVAKDRAVFAEGALTAAQWLIKQPAGIYQFGDLFRTDE